MSISDRDFDALVDEAVANIPEKYADVHVHVVFQVADTPSPEQRARAGLQSGEMLFGLFEGVPHIQRAAGSSGILPAVITIFRHPMIELFPERSRLQKQVSETVWHEVAHYFGLSHAAMHRITDRHRS